MAGWLLYLFLFALFAAMVLISHLILQVLGKEADRGDDLHQDLLEEESQTESSKS